MLDRDYQPFNSLEMEDYYDDAGDIDPDLVNYDMNYPDEGQRYISFIEITQACVLQTVLDVSKTYFIALSLCFTFQLINFCPINMIIKHILSGALGLGLLYYYFEGLTVHCLSLLLVFYFIAHTLQQYKIRLSFTSFLLLIYLTISEFTFEGSDWARIRNIQMLMVMKIMSLVKDYESKHIEEFPSFVNYFGYICCLGNCLFGPWIDYRTYLEGLEPKTWTVAYGIEIGKSVVSGFLFFLLSMCYIDWMLQEYSPYSSVTMYGKALEFRSGHYFVMYMSCSYILAAGFRPMKDDATLTRPNRIEFPHSLVEVVIYWNIPMHNWLKQYVFKPLQAYGNFIAVLGTYFVSSLLHGLNYQLSGILLSLGLYTYVEYVFRRKLSMRLNACVSSKQCKPYCDRHRHTDNKLAVCFINRSLSILALYHLSYFGFLLDLRVDQSLDFYESFSRWRMLGFVSHYIVLATYIISLVL